MQAPEHGTWWRADAACADPELLPLVDAAFDRPGGPAGMHLRTQVCTQARHSDHRLTPGPGVWGACTTS